MSDLIWALRVSRPLRLLLVLAFVGIMELLAHFAGGQDIKASIHIPTYYVGLGALLYALRIFVWDPGHRTAGRARKWAMRGAAVLAALTVLGIGFIEGELLTYYPNGLAAAIVFAIPALVVGAFAGFVCGLFASLVDVTASRMQRT